MESRFDKNQIKNYKSNIYIKKLNKTYKFSIIFKFYFIYIFFLNLLFFKFVFFMLNFLIFRKK